MDFEKSSIERLKRTLYSRNEKIVPKEKRTQASDSDLDNEKQVAPNWGDRASFDIPLDMPERDNSFFNKFLVGSLVFFVLSLSVALFIFFGGVNMISSGNVDIKITAPSSVASGEETLAALSIVNLNRADLEEVSLYVTYPEGAESADSSGKPLSREKADLGTILSGQSKDYTARAFLFGEKDSIKTFTFRIEYKIKGSNAVFSKEKTYDVIIGSSPILLNVDYPKQIDSGQTITLSIDIASNSSVVVQNSMVKVEYPYGFTYKDSNVKPFRDNSVWNIGDLKSGDKKTLRITGVLIGQDLEERSFRISSGTRTAGTNDFDTALAAVQATIAISKSLFNLSVKEEGEPSVGQPVSMIIKWQNTLPDKMANNRITASLGGNVLDKASVSVGNSGLYRSIDTTIIWDKNSTDDLSGIMPDESGQVTFSFASIADSIVVRSIKNPHIDVHVVMTGDRVGSESGTISSSADVSVKFPSTLTITSKSYRSIGPFSNTGPIPPRADKESTYTITWTLTNTTNDLKDAIVSAALPPCILWKEEISPASGKISYNPDTGIVSWNVGTVSSGSGFLNSAKAVSFKVSVTPSITDIGSAPVLLGEAEVSASDTYAETSLVSTAQAVTAQYSDPGYKTGNNIVIK